MINLSIIMWVLYICLVMFHEELGRFILYAKRYIRYLWHRYILKDTFTLLLSTPSFRINDIITSDFRNDIKLLVIWYKEGKEGKGGTKYYVKKENRGKGITPQG